MLKATNERELVLEGLLEITENNVFSNIAIHQLLTKHQDLDKRSRAFVSHVIIGTLERLIEIDYIINLFSTIQVRKMKPIIRNILRSGVYQLKYMENIPPSAVCNEAVKLASQRGFKNLKGFVNGNLRNIARNLEHISYPTDPLLYLEVKYSIPSWILKLWLQEYGLSRSELDSQNLQCFTTDLDTSLDRLSKINNDELAMNFEIVERMVQSFHEKRPLTIRTNLSKIQPDDLKDNLEKQGIKVKEHPYLDYVFKISGIDYLAGIEDFQKGDFYVQDVSSMLVAELAKPNRDSVVLDLCAAPGGKALHMADKLLCIGEYKRLSKNEESKSTDSGVVFACDLTDRKVALIQENIDRAGFGNVKAIKKDATIREEEFLKKADIVIADVPCSGLGILGKKPDLKYNTSLEQMGELVKLQRKILTNACAYVKPQGTLMFSTCTINPKENQENVHWLLENFPEFKLIPIHEELPVKLRKKIRVQKEMQGENRENLKREELTLDSIRENTLQLLPGVNECDGFFIAKFRRT